MIARGLIVVNIIILVSVLSSCQKEPTYTPIAYSLDRPYKFPIFPNDNEIGLTEEGIALGKSLFYDPILSKDSSISCASCHKQGEGFADSRQFSEGVDGSQGTRQAMPIVNLAWHSDFFWDGRANSIAKQALKPVEDPNEMKAHWPIVLDKLNTHDLYPSLFQKAFSNRTITKELVTEAISQFEKTLISANSKFDLFISGRYQLTEAEARGRDLFFSEQADCFHCHSGTLLSDGLFHNNGLDAMHIDKGLENFTKDPNDRAKFKTPTLRNISYTAPYMHDGRFATLDEVIDFYSTGLQNSATIDPLMKQINNNGVNLTAQEKADLKAFLLTFNDEEFINNPDFASPF